MQYLMDLETIDPVRFYALLALGLMVASLMVFLFIFLFFMFIDLTKETIKMMKLRGCEILFWLTIFLIIIIGFVMLIVKRGGNLI